MILITTMTNGKWAWVLKNPQSARAVAMRTGFATEPAAKTDGRIFEQMNREAGYAVHQ